jgi:hypothetical protein
VAGLTNQIATGLVTEVAGVTGIVATAATPVDAVPGTPFYYVGPPKLVQIGGQWEQRIYNFPLHLMIARLSTEDRDQVTINDLMDLTLNAFRTGITLAVSGVISAEIKAADTDKFYELGGVTYQSVDFDCLVTVGQPATYTP